MERLLKIKNYRNIGIKGEECLLLNTSLKLDEMGSTVILIGENNLGKSNVINALKKYGGNSLNKVDDTYDNDFFEDLKPELTLMVRDGNNEFYHDKNIAKQDETNGYFYRIENETKDDNTPKIYGDLKKYSSFLKKIAIPIRNQYYNNLLNCINFIDSIQKQNEFENMDSNAYTTMYDYINYVNNNLKNCNPDIDAEIKNEHIDVNAILEYLKVKKEGEAAEFKRVFREKYGFDFEPKIFQYEQKTKLTDQQLKTNWNYPNDSVVAVVLKYLDYSKEEVNKFYSLYQQTGSMAPLKNLERKVNSKIKVIDKKFNSVFRTFDTSYSFALKFEEEYIRLIVRSGEKDLIINRNSDGFTWFFNFFFNFILKYESKPGDIILLDDQGYGLMPQGIHELHNYLREYAKDKGITFVIATASEHFVDLNYLEEIRIIDRIDGDKARITSKITLFNDGDVDALKQIKKAIMINGNVFDNDDVQQIYVEGITDYNYLTAFAKVFDYTDLLFIPFNGVKKEDIVDKLKRKHHTNIFLVDGDSAGLEFKKKYENDDSIICPLSEADSKFTTIESLFSKEEIERLNLADKSYSISCNFKENINKYIKGISKETQNNFRKVLDYIRTI